MNIDIYIGDKLINSKGGFFIFPKYDKHSAQSYKFRIDSYDETFTTESYGDYNKVDIYVPTDNLDMDSIIVDYISFDSDIIICSIVVKDGKYKGHKAFFRCTIQHCFIDTNKLMIDYKYRRLKTLQYLNI